MSSNLVDIKQISESIKPIDKNRFTIFVKSKQSIEFQLLQTWLHWFHSRNIPARIAFGGNAGGYALYREGLIEIELKYWRKE